MILWDADSNQVRERLNLDTTDWEIRATGNFNCPVAFSRDGKLLATGSPRVVELWDPGRGERLRTIPRKAAFGRDNLAFSPDGATLAGLASGRDGRPGASVQLWDTSSGAEVASLPAEDYVQALSFSPDGTTLATGGWSFAEADEAPSPKPRDAVPSLTLWDVAEHRPRASLSGNESWVDSGAFSPDGRLLASGGRNELIVRDAASGKTLYRSRARQSPVQCLAFSPDGKVLAVALWNKSQRMKLLTVEELLRPPDD